MFYSSVMFLGKSGHRNVMTGPCHSLSACQYWINRASRNHRMVEVGRPLKRSFVPLPLPKQGYLEPVAHMPSDCKCLWFQSHVHTALERLQRRGGRGRLHKLSGLPVSVVGPPHSKKAFSEFRGNLLSCHWAPSLHVFIYIDYIPLGLPMLKSLSSQPSSYERWQVLLSHRN